MRVIVTGASGFVGRHVARLLGADPTVSLLTTARRAAPGVDITADLSSPADIAGLMREARPDVIVHAAGLRHGSPFALRQGNVVAVRNLLEAAAVAPERPRVLLLGSAAEYGPRLSADPLDESARCKPQSDYGRSKLAATRIGLRLRRERGLDVTVLRLFNVCGSGMGGLPGDVAAYLAGEAGRLDWERDARSLAMVRDFVDVSDVAEACRRATAIAALPPIINICSGVGRSFAALIAEMVEISSVALALPAPVGPEDAVIGDPALCLASLGFRPSSNLREALGAAIGKGRSDP